MVSTMIVTVVPRPRAAPSTAACALVDLNAALLRMQAMHAGKPFAQGSDTDHLPTDMAALIAYLPSHKPQPFGG